MKSPEQNRILKPLAGKQKYLEEFPISQTGSQLAWLTNRLQKAVDFLGHFFCKIHAKFLRIESWLL
ncbi:MAG: hypothetical protein WCS94_14720 [Verrucomicrobiota bacterium]